MSRVALALAVALSLTLSLTGCSDDKNPPPADKDEKQSANTPQPTPTPDNTKADPDNNKPQNTSSGKADDAKQPTPTPTPAPQPAATDQVFQVVEQMPRFPGCEDADRSDAERKRCADKKMLEFIYANLKYPAIAQENGVEGIVVVTFVVGRDGAISDPKVVRDIGAQCGQEALRVVNLMNSQSNKWTPGRHRGQPVRVQINLPVKFKLQ